MTDSAVADHLTRLKLKLLEKKLENEQEAMEDCESPVPETRNYGAHDYALQSALRRRKDLLQQLREQNLLEEFSQPRGSPRMQRKHYRREPEYVYQAPPPAHLLPPPPPPPPPPPRIIQQTLPQQPATIIQQIPQHPPLITQIPSPQAFPPAPRSGSIKEDMVEMMLMQNAQMHQIIMQNMMLKSLPPPPPPAYSPANGPTAPLLHHGQLLPAPIVVRMEKMRPSAVHHHHYTPTGLPAMPPQLGFPTWPSVIPPGLGSQMGGFPSDSHHLPIPATATHMVPAHGLLGLPPGL
ncbi:uncharacterized protein C21orf58 homolog [Sphaerodactylus townsendi]|uniref:uncharacterized protein C21orf58 homolog n=1 Tax=Sphaerodactylus townsendi TaxID=933632 RepID=UPI0020271ABC|nr:uncharacterized protein C21orf58 homolog [Sphaerodactylus townsendi]XP_048358501.1 uncharacterized protein C21orf58 homolog [Sphaerodactylus townsendi]